MCFSIFPCKVASPQCWPFCHSLARLRLFCVIRSLLSTCPVPSFFRSLEMDRTRFFIFAFASPYALAGLCPLAHPAAHPDTALSSVSPANTPLTSVTLSATMRHLCCGSLCSCCRACQVLLLSIPFFLALVARDSSNLQWRRNLLHVWRAVSVFFLS